MTTKMTLTYCGMEGTGRTVKEAKQDAARRIEAALDGYYNPVLLFAGNHMAVLARNPMYGWGYRLIDCGHADIGCSREVLYLSHGGNGDLGDTERGARKHLGSLATPADTCRSAADVHPIVLDRHDRQEIADLCRNSRKYHFALSLGHNENVAHHLMCGGGYLVGMNDAEFEKQFAEQDEAVFA